MSDTQRIKIEDNDHRLGRLEESIEQIDINIRAMREILELFNDTKGFINTVRGVSKVAIWFGATSAALTAIYHAIKHFGQS